MKLARSSTRKPCSGNAPATPLAIDVSLPNPYSRPYSMIGTGRNLPLPPMRVLNRPTPTVAVERRADGTEIVSAGRDLPADYPLIIDRLREAAERRPDTVFLAERRGPEQQGRGRQWQRLTYAEAWAKTGAVASWLIAQGFGPDSQPVAILSDNSLENALFMFGAQRAGVVVASISPK